MRAPAETPIAIVERGTLPGQRVVRGRLGQLVLLAESRRITAPAMLIVGEVAALAAAPALESPHSPADDCATARPKYAKQGV